MGGKPPSCLRHKETMEVDAGLSTSGAGAEAPGSGFEEEDLDHIETKAFSATEYLNKLFPNEQSLSGLDEFLVKLRRRIRKVNDEILVAVRQQSQTGSRAKDDLDQAQNGIEDLSQRITEIK